MNQQVEQIHIKLRTSVSGKDYEDLVTDQWNLNDNMRKMKLLLTKKIVRGNRDKCNKQLDQE